MLGNRIFTSRLLIFLLSVLPLLPGVSCTGNRCNVLSVDFRTAHAYSLFTDSDIFYIRDDNVPGGPGGNLFKFANVMFTQDGLVLTARGRGSGDARVREGAEIGSVSVPVEIPGTKYSAWVMPARARGVVTAFFTYLHDDNLDDNNQEIDIEVLETFYGAPSVYFTTWKRYDPEGGEILKETKSMEVDETFFSAFHHFEIEWHSEHVTFSVDDVVVAENRHVVPWKGGHVMFNLWVADEWAGGEFQGEATAVIRSLCVEVVD